MIIWSPIGLGPVLNPLLAIGICIILMVIMPIAPIVYMATKGKTDLDVSNREIRAGFFGFSLICYAGAFLTYALAECHIMESLAAAYFTVTLAVMIATFRSKVSVHGAGVGGPGTALIYVFGIAALPVVLVWIAVIWARPILKQHSTSQSIVGVIIGVLVTTLTYFLIYPS
jgi:membrane-associated phospholipid phosphatase